MFDFWRWPDAARPRQDKIWRRYSSLIVHWEVLTSDGARSHVEVHESTRNSDETGVRPTASTIRSARRSDSGSSAAQAMSQRTPSLIPQPYNPTPYTSHPLPLPSPPTIPHQPSSDHLKSARPTNSKLHQVIHKSLQTDIVRENRLRRLRHPATVPAARRARVRRTGVQFREQEARLRAPGVADDEAGEGEAVLD